MLLFNAPDHRLSRRRRALAAGLEGAIERARPRPGQLSAQIPVARRAVLRSEDRLCVLAAVLSSERELPAVGLGAVRALLTDGAGPLFDPDGDLPSALDGIEHALGLA